MSIEDYKSEKAMVLASLLKLESFVEVVETFKFQLEKKTEGYLAAINSQKSPYQHTGFYSKKWFRFYLGCKDEARLLINGALHRKYHYNQHSEFLHTRKNESNYYKAPLGMSSCSVDGLEYCIRSINEIKYVSLPV